MNGWTAVPSQGKQHRLRFRGRRRRTVEFCPVASQTGTPSHRRSREADPGRGRTGGGQPRAEASSSRGPCRVNTDSTDCASQASSVAAPNALAHTESDTPRTRRVVQGAEPIVETEVRIRRAGQVPSGASTSGPASETTMNDSTCTPLPGHRLRELACAASVHPRTFAKYLKGERISPLPASRIAAVLRRRGLEHLLAHGDQPTAESK